MKSTFKALIVLESAKFRVVDFNKAMSLPQEIECVGYIDDKDQAWSFEGGLLDTAEKVYELSKEKEIDGL